MTVAELREALEGLPDDMEVGITQEFEMELAWRGDGLSPRVKELSGWPLSEMMTRGWIADVDLRDIDGLESALCGFFGVGSMGAIPRTLEEISASLRR